MADEQREPWGYCDECDRWTSMRKAFKAGRKGLMLCQRCRTFRLIRTQASAYPEAARVVEEIDARELRIDAGEMG